MNPVHEALAYLLGQLPQNRRVQQLVAALKDQPPTPSNPPGGLEALLDQPPGGSKLGALAPKK